MIRDWKKIYETAESRKVKFLNWVSIPNKHDGRGFKRLMRNPDGPVAFSCFVLMCQIASRTHRDERDGRLGNVEGAFTALDLADKTGMSEENFEKSFKILSHKDISWIEWIDAKRSSGKISDLPDVPLEKVDSTAVIQTDSNNNKHTAPASAPSPDVSQRARAQMPNPNIPENEFGYWAERWYARHPKKKDRFLVPPAALKVWNSTPVPLELFRVIDKKHAEFSSTEAWKEMGGRFCPTLAQWLEDLGWTGEVPEPRKQQSGKMSGYERDMAEAARLEKEEAEEEAAKYKQ